MRAVLVIVALFVAGLGLLAAGMQGPTEARVAPSTQPQPQTQRQPLTGPELRWIRGYARWSIAVHAQGLKPTRRGLLRDCAAVLRVDAGPAPTRRLRSAAHHVERACQALAAGRPESVIADRLARADDQLTQLFLASTRLPASSQASVASRRSPALGAIAGELGGEKAEVRCWTYPDWRRVIREEAAWTDTPSEPHLVDGLADTGSGRIELLLEDCNLLERLEVEDVAARTREGLIAAADALSVFSHEIQHFRHPHAGEGAIECASAERLDDVGRALGLDGREIGLLRDAYVESVRPQLSHEYRVGCDP
jgi:hypothetical protein